MSDQGVDANRERPPAAALGPRAMADPPDSNELTQPRSHPPSEDDGSAMGKLLVAGAAIGVPLVFALSYAMVLAAGARGPGAVFIAAWGALVGGTFIGAAVVLAKRLGELGAAPGTTEPSAVGSAAPDTTEPAPRGGRMPLEGTG